MSIKLFVWYCVGVYCSMSLYVHVPPDCTYTCTKCRFVDIEIPLSLIFS